MYNIYLFRIGSTYNFYLFVSFFSNEYTHIVYCHSALLTMLISHRKSLLLLKQGFISKPTGRKTDNHFNLLNIIFSHNQWCQFAVYRKFYRYFNIYYLITQVHLRIKD